MTSAYPGNENGMPYNPCVDYPTIFDLVDSALGSGSVNWKYYTPATDILWNAPWFVAHLYPKTQNLVVDSTGTQFEDDVDSGNLAPLTYIVPCDTWSDHEGVYPPNKKGQTGPYWVNWIVNKIGKSSTYWNNTTIIVTWDDWGGWYDHMTPFHTPNVYNNNEDPYEYGYRVPMLVISPYLNAPGTVDHYPLVNPLPNPPLRTQASILHYIEAVFGTPSLGAEDSESDNLAEMFNYNRQPLKFVPVDNSPTFPAGRNDCRQNEDNIDG